MQLTLLPGNPCSYNAPAHMARGRHGGVDPGSKSAGRARSGPRLDRRGNHRWGDHLVPDVWWRDSFDTASRLAQHSSDGGRGDLDRHADPVTHRNRYAYQYCRGHGDSDAKHDGNRNSDRVADLDVDRDHDRHVDADANAG